MCRARKRRCTSWAAKSRRCIRSARLFHGCGLNITVMSLNGKLNVGVISCPDLMPDLWRLADDFDVALEELLECADRRALERAVLLGEQVVVELERGLLDPAAL